jgi:hypothetical protein
LLEFFRTSGHMKFCFEKEKRKERKNAINIFSFHMVACFLVCLLTCFSCLFIEEEGNIVICISSNWTVSNNSLPYSSSGDNIIKHWTAQLSCMKNWMVITIFLSNNGYVFNRVRVYNLFNSILYCFMYMLLYGQILSTYINILNKTVLDFYCIVSWTRIIMSPL